MHNLKNILNNKINKDSIYNNVIDNSVNIRSFKWHYLAVSGLIVIAFISFYLLSIKPELKERNVKLIDNDIVNIYNLDNNNLIKETDTRISATTLDNIDLTHLRYLADCLPDCEKTYRSSLNLNLWQIPNYLVNKEYNEVYIKFENSFNTLYEYNINYISENNAKYLKIYIAKDNLIYHKYYKVINDVNASYIDNFEVKLLNDNNTFIALFKYEGYNYEIKTNVSQNELIKLIKSVAKLNREGKS